MSYGVGGVVVAGRLGGKIAFITGTAQGQGLAAAQLFAAEGAKVVGCDLHGGRGEAAAKEVRRSGGEMVFRRVDLADGEQVKAWLEYGASHFGGIDILYNNASAFRTPLLEEMSYEDWSYTIRNELDVVYWACRSAFAMMRARGGGVILNTSSTAGLVGFPGIGDFAHAATKGGVIALTRQIAVEGAQYNIRANAVSPGVIDTPLTQSKLANEDFRRQLIDMQLVKRVGVAMDVAYCALYLVSDESSWVTGANFVVDGGRTAW